MTCPHCAGTGMTKAPAFAKRAVDLAIAVAYPYVPGRYLRILKRYVQRDGEDAVIARWKIYLDTGRHFWDDGAWTDQPRPISSLTPERFRDSYDEWAP